jgi:hypothetical protein
MVMVTVIKTYLATLYTFVIEMKVYPDFRVGNRKEIWGKGTGFSRPVDSPTLLDVNEDQPRHK